MEKTSIYIGDKFRDDAHNATIEITDIYIGMLFSNQARIKYTFVLDDGSTGKEDVGVDTFFSTYWKDLKFVENTKGG